MKAGSIKDSFFSQTTETKFWYLFFYTKWRALFNFSLEALLLKSANKCQQSDSQQLLGLKS